MKKFLIALSAIAALALAGCGATCEDLCEEAKDCSNATAEDKEADCAKTCADAEKLADDTNCRDKYDDVLSCSADADVCAEELEGCDTEVSAYSACMLAACMADPSICE